MSSPAFIQRDGSESIRQLAQKMCILVNTFEPTLRKNYPDNTTLQTVLDWAKTACTMVPLLDGLIADAPSSDPSPDDPLLWPGVNPAAPSQPPLPEED